MRDFTDGDFERFAMLVLPIWLILVIALGVAIWRKRRS